MAKTQHHHNNNNDDMARKSSSTLDCCLPMPKPVSIFSFPFFYNNKPKQTLMRNFFLL